MKNNSHFNYDLCQKIFNLKQHESDTIDNVITHMMEILHKIYHAKNGNHIYLLGKSLKFTKEVDPSYYLVLKYAIGSIQELIIELPLIRNGDSIMINGNMYNPILQMIDKPLIIKKKNNIAVLMTNLGNIYSTPIVENKMIRIILSLNKKFTPPALIWFFGFLGVNGFEEMTGVKLIIDQEDYEMPLNEYFFRNKLKFDRSNIKEEFKCEKFDWLLNQGAFLKDELSKNNIGEKLIGLTAKDLIAKNRKGWEVFLSAYDGARILTKVSVHQALLPLIDIFSAKYMKYNNVVMEMLRAFSKEIQPLDIKDLSQKRIRCYEIFLITFMKHIYNIGMNCMYNKITTVSKEKRLRIYDNALSSHLTSYDGMRNNSIMRLSERTKITQTGDGGYTSDMFIGSARDIHESQYGTICPINTPDREKCGVTLYLSPSKISKFDNMYYWPDEEEHQNNRLSLKNEEDYLRFSEKEKLRLEKERNEKEELREKEEKVINELM
jgi:hypothetical protein